jgi:hypothetical protein
VVELAKANGLVVLAANAPGELVKQARREGLDAVRGNAHVAREVSTPEDDYRDAVLEAMRGHPGATEAQLQSFYVAQCVRDDTMAETITDYLKERRQLGDRPLVVLICGAMHSDHGRGTVARIKSRMPDLDVRVVSAEAVDDLAAGVYAAPKTVGAYVVVAPKAASESPQAPVATVDDVTHVTQPSSVPPSGKPVTAGPTGPAATPPAPATQDPPPPEGARPGLGLMPDYGGGGDGLHVERVTEGSAAEKAGIEAGDVIVSFAGKTITAVESYMEVLGQQTIGKTVTVRVRRGDAEVDLQVKVGVSRR